MNFQWATRSVPPTFIPTVAGQIDDGASSGSGVTNTTTLKFHNTTYTLYSVQIVNATHNNWIIPAASKQKNTEDIILTFQNESATFAAYVIIVLPILRIGSAQPRYLQALATSNQAPNSYSLSDCLPTNNNSLFAYYVTCLDGYTAHKNPDNAYVFVGVEGVSVSSDLMEKISNKIGPTPILHFLSRFADKISVIGNGDFNQYILSTRTLLNPAAKSTDYSFHARTDATNAYKCVPLDPDKNVVNDTLKVDLESGTLLSDVLAERAGLINDTAPTPQTRAQQKKIELMFESVFGSIAAFIVVIMIGYSVYTYTNGPVVAPISEAPESPWLIYVGIALFCIVLGITIGVTAF
jgi:hypothetical protein